MSSPARVTIHAGDADLHIVRVPVPFAVQRIEAIRYWRDVQRREFLASRAAELPRHVRCDKPQTIRL